MSGKEKNKLIRKSAERSLLNPAEQFESETRLSCAPERILNPVLIKRDKPSFFDRIQEVSFSQNGKFMIAYNRVHIYTISIPSCKCIQVIETENRGNVASAISANGNYIVSTGFHVKTFQKEKTIVRKFIVWNTVLGTKLFEIEDSEMDTILKVEISSDDQKIVVLGYIKNSDSKQRKLSAYDFKTGDLSYRICGTVNDFVLTPDGKNAYFSEHDQIKKIDLKNGKTERIFQCEQFIVDLAISADGKTIIGLEGSKLNDDVDRYYHIKKTNFRVIDLEKNEMKLIKTDKYHEKICLHPGGNYLLSNDRISDFKPWEYKRINAWDLLKGTPKDIGINLQNKSFPIYFSPDGKYLVQMKDSEIVFWDLDRKKKFSSIDFTQDYTGRSTFWINNNKMLLWGEKKSLDQISLKDGFVRRKIFRFNKIEGESFKVNKEGKLIAFTPDEKTLEVWDIEKERKMFSCELEKHWYFDAVTFSNAQKETLISYRNPDTIIIRNLNSGEISQIPKIKDTLGIKELHFCKDARTIFTQDYPFYVWYDIEWARPILIFRKPKDHSEYADQKFGKINTLYIDHDNMTCFVADTHSYGEERHILLLDLKHTQSLQEFTGYNSDVIKICVDHDMKTFISIHKDGEIRKWDIKTGQCIQHFSKYQNIVDSTIKYLEITENNKYLVIVGYHNQIYFWDYQTGEFLAKTFNLDNGYLWITPPDEFAPNGWLHTDRPDLISLIEMNKANQQNPTFIYEDDQRFKDYMQIYNDQDMVMTRLNDWDRYQELLNIRLGNKNIVSGQLLEQGNLVLRLLTDNPNKQ